MISEFNLRDLDWLCLGTQYRTPTRGPYDGGSRIKYAHFIPLVHSYIIVQSPRSSLTTSLNCMMSCAPSLAIVTQLSPSRSGQSCFTSLVCNRPSLANRPSIQGEEQNSRSLPYLPYWLRWLPWPSIPTILTFC
jgi:hypothetical protein